MKRNLNIKVSQQEILTKLGNSEKKALENQQEAITKAIQEVTRNLNISFVYNVEVDLIGFEFKIYEPLFNLKQLSFAAVSLGEEIETPINLYRMKGEETIVMLMETAVDILLDKLLDHVNFLICNENYEEFKQGPRKLTKDNSELKKEEKIIVDYLQGKKIGIVFDEDENLASKYSRVFIVEWAARKNKTSELAKRCEKCNAENCKLRI